MIHIPGVYVLQAGRLSARDKRSVMRRAKTGFVRISPAGFNAFNNYVEVRVGSAVIEVDGLDNFSQDLLAFCNARHRRRTRAKIRRAEAREKGLS